MAPIIIPLRRFIFSLASKPNAKTKKTYGCRKKLNLLFIFYMKLDYNTAESEQAVKFSFSYNQFFSLFFLNYFLSPH